MERYLDTLSDEKKAELFQALGAELTQADLEANPREINQTEAQALGEALTAKWQEDIMAEGISNNVEPTFYADKVLIEKFGTDADKEAFEAWKLENLN